ncbi:hypothetical protein ACG83_40570 [Frankia sp. R43]|nr:hypothetical protein ACG83_40570 [Frankia sp. R43]
MSPLALAFARQMITLAENTRLLAAVREREKQLNYQAFHDPLTGLANRALFARRLPVDIDEPQQVDRYRRALSEMRSVALAGENRRELLARIRQEARREARQETRDVQAPAGTLPPLVESE